MRGERPFLFTNLKTDEGAREVAHWLEEHLKAPPAERRSVIDAHAPHGHDHEHTHHHHH
jgi:hypothetical protein